MLRSRPASGQPAGRLHRRAAGRCGARYRRQGGEHADLRLSGRALRISAACGSRPRRPSSSEGFFPDVAARMVRIFGVGELQVGPVLDALPHDLVELGINVGGGEVTVRIRHRRDARTAGAGRRPGRGARGGRAGVLHRRPHGRRHRRGRAPRPGADARGGRVLHRRHARRPDHRPRRQLRLLHRRGRQLLQPGQDGPPRRAARACWRSTGRSPRRSPARWRRVRAPRWAPTSRSPSPASPAPAAARRTSRSGSCTSAAPVPAVRACAAVRSPATATRCARSAPPERCTSCGRRSTP